MSTPETTKLLEVPYKPDATDLERLLELSGDLLLIARSDGMILWVSPSWTELLGWTFDEMVGTLCLEFIHPDDLSATADAIEVWAKAGTSAVNDGFRNRYKTKGGAYRLLKWYGQESMTLPSGLLVSCNVARDVTEIDAALTQERQTTHALEGVLKQINHQLRAGIMQAMWALSEYERHDPGDNPDQLVARALEILEGSMTTLEWTRRYAAVCVRGFVKSKPHALEDLARSALNKSGSEVVVDLEPGTCCCARDEVVQALAALFNNVTKHGGTACKVHCDTDWLCVDDDGPGIAPEDRELVLTLNGRANAEVEGDGVGLALVDQVAKLHGGRVTLETSPQGGLRVLMQFRGV